MPDEMADTTKQRGPLVLGKADSCKPKIEELKQRVEVLERQLRVLKNVLRPYYDVEGVTSSLYDSGGTS